MKYLILAMLLAVVQASPPVPRQAPNGSASTGENNQKQSQTKKAPSNLTPSNVGQNQAETADRNRNEQTNQNAGNPVAISKLPPVTVNNRRDWADWGTWFFTFMLAFTGLLQIILLWRTLKVTSKQADISKQQEQRMAEAGAQTERIISQMKESEVRELRAYVGVSKVILVFKNPLQPQGIIEIQNFGKTPAYKVRHWVGVTIGPHPLVGVLPQFPESPHSSVTDIFPGIKNVNSANLSKPVPAGTKIGTQDNTVFIWGNVTYEDTFGNQWYTNYRFIFGGPGGGVLYREGELLLGTMYPDSGGNDAS